MARVRGVVRNPKHILVYIYIYISIYIYTYIYLHLSKYIPPYIPINLLDSAEAPQEQVASLPEIPKNQPIVDARSNQNYFETRTRP